MAHLVHVSSLSGQTKPVSGQLYETATGESGLVVPISCCCSATGIRFLDHPLSAEELSRPCGWLTGQHPDLDGIVTFHTAEIRPGWVLSVPRGDGVHTTGS